MNGIEWLVEAFGCSEVALRDTKIIEGLFQDIVSELELNPVGVPVWHKFPGSGGVTGVWLLQESHLAIHSFPEFRSACLNLFCCSRRRSLDWNRKLSHALGATEVRVREYQRLYGPHLTSATGARVEDQTHA